MSACNLIIIKTKSMNVPFLEVRIAAEASSFQEGFHYREPDKVHLIYTIL